MKTLSFFAGFGLVLAVAEAGPLKTAVVTTVVNDVKMSERSGAARPIGTGQAMGGSSTLLTGKKSRAAMTFPDKTVTRVGANSVFSFNSGSRDMEIKQGSFLLQVPKGAGGATIRTATVTAGITGTTTMMEYSPARWVKFICLEGTAKLTNKSGDSVQVPPGQMITMHPDAARFPRPIIVNIGKMVKTSALADDAAFGELDQAAEEAIDETIAQQMNDKRDGTLRPAGLAGHGVVVPEGDETNRTLFPEIYYSSDHSPNGP